MALYRPPSNPSAQPTYTTWLHTDQMVTDGVQITFRPRCCACQKVIGNHATHPYSLECHHCGATTQEGVVPAEARPSARQRTVPLALTPEPPAS